MYVEQGSCCLISPEACPRETDLKKPCTAMATCWLLMLSLSLWSMMCTLNRAQWCQALPHSGAACVARCSDPSTESMSSPLISCRILGILVSFLRGVCGWVGLKQLGFIFAHGRKGKQSRAVSALVLRVAGSIVSFVLLHLEFQMNPIAIVTGRQHG